MQAITKRNICSKVDDAALRKFISLARGEQPLPDRYTDEQMVADVRKTHPDEWTLSGDVVWSGSRRVMNAIEKHRGLSRSEQFERGIVSMLTRVQGLLISYEMRKSFSVEELSKLPHFDENGEFQISSRHDFMCPVMKNGMITELRFYTIAEMKKWPK